ncbi:hypothetical protein QYF36_017595 [Acer negundo]|nr:hypothetical protein QYF36_017595 [Acer negundo]
MERLDLVDCIRASNICKSWRSVAVNRKKKIKTAQVPWLLSHRDNHQPRTKSLRFFDFSLGSSYNISLPRSSTTLFGWWYCGSSKGWLVIAKVAASFRDATTLALCRPGDKSWSIFKGGVNQKEEWIVKNVAFVSYLVESNGELLIVHRIKSVIGSTIHPNNPSSDLLDLMIMEDVETVAKLKRVKDGEDNYYDTNDQNDDEDHIHEDDQEEEDHDDDNMIDFKYFETSKFEVFKIDDPSANNNNNMSVTRLNRPGDRMLFVSKLGSVSVKAPEFNEMKENYISFVEDEEQGNYHIGISRESRIFYLEDERIERCFPSMNHMSWFAPNL